MKRPNILFLMSDQHRFDISGFMGNTVVRTPVLDSLAQNAQIFDNAYCPSPVCIPSRQSMMTGLLPRQIGCVSYGDDIKPFSLTFANWFARYAYRTIVCGKLHHEGIDQNQGWTLRVGHDSGIGDRFVPNKIPEEFEKYKIKSMWWPWAKEIKRAGVGRDPHTVIDEYNTLGALNVIDQYFNDSYYDHPDSHRPLLLKVSLRLPHYPYMCDEEKFGYYLNRVQPYLNESVPDHPNLGRHKVRKGVEVDDREIRRAIAAYYGKIETMDALFGKVVEKLAYVGQDLNEWIVIYCSDHGDMLGEHGSWMKHTFMEGSVRVPLFVRYPKRYAKARRYSQNVNIIDLFATLCELAGLDVPENLYSRSLCPLMDGNVSSWENMTVSQLDDGIMIKWDSLKHMWYEKDGPEVLFDLAKDPHENVNLVNDRAYAEILNRLRKKREMFA